MSFLPESVQLVLAVFALLSPLLVLGLVMWGRKYFVPNDQYNAQRGTDAETLKDKLDGIGARIDRENEKLLTRLTVTEKACAENVGSRDVVIGQLSTLSTKVHDQERQLGLVLELASQASNRLEKEALERHEKELRQVEWKTRMEIMTGVKKLDEKKE